jgi:ketosteroid isomerase-like protein
MSEPNLQIVRRAYEAASTGDVEAAKELAGQDIELTSVLSSVEGGVYRGHPGVEQWFADVADTWETLDQKPERFIEIDEQRTLALTRVRGKGRGSGVEVNIHVASIWTIRDGKIVGLHTYRSLDEAREAAGLSE